MKVIEKFAGAVLVFLVMNFIAFDLFADESSDSLELMSWHPPPPGEKIDIIEGLDLKTLEILTESGALQYYQPRKEKDRWDVIVGMMIHAPLDVVWDIASDYMANCRLLNETYDYCEELPGEDDKIRMHFKLHTSVLKFSFKLDIVDEFTEKPPYRWHLYTVDGDLKGRELEVLLVPVDENRTMCFLRYFGAMRSMNAIVRITLSFIPEFESPIYAPAATYHVRAYKNEAEKRVGYSPPGKPAPIDYDRLDIKTMQQLSNWYGGLLRETREGDVINNTGFSAIDAPPGKVWSVITDFENYSSIFPGSSTKIEERSDNEATIIHNGLARIDVYIFDFSIDVRARYAFEEPSRMSFKSIEGLYKDSYGEFFLLPFDGGKKTFAFATVYVNLKNDESLTMKMVKSGPFPFESTVNMSYARDMLNAFKHNSEKLP